MLNPIRLNIDNCVRELKSGKSGMWASTCKEFPTSWYPVGVQLKDPIMMVRWEERTLTREQILEGLKC